MKKDWSVSYEDFESWKQLDEDDRLLVQAAYGMKTHMLHTEF